MKYNELNKKQSAELNDFPIFFAFSEKQFHEGLKKLGADKSEICSIPGSGFIRKTDSKALAGMFKRHSDEMKKAFEDDKFLIGAIRYELANHEFCITGDSSDAMGALDLSLSDEHVSKCFAIARKEYLKTTNTKRRHKIKITAYDINGGILRSCGFVPLQSVRRTVAQMKELDGCDLIVSDGSKKSHYKTKNGWRCN